MKPSSLLVRRSRVHGRGAFATRDIAKGERIIEYTGKRISHAQADSQSPDDEANARHHTFLFAVDNRVVVDASHDGNNARYINHSCDPNCEINIVRGHVYVDALRDVAKGEELSYDYWYVTDERYSLADLRRIYPCRCGAEACRGTLARPPRRARKA